MRSGAGQRDFRPTGGIARWAGVSLALWLAAIALWPLWTQRDLTWEDGYYYLKIAQHVAAGQGSTFDGLHATNGYHPLWLLTLSAALWLAGGVLSTLIVSQILQAGMMVAALWILHGAIRRRWGRGAAHLAVLLWTALTVQLWWSGLEFTLQVLLSCIALKLTLRLRDAGSSAPADRDRVALGIVLGLLVLARLETVLLATIVVAILAVEPSGGDSSVVSGRQGRHPRPWHLGRLWRVGGPPALAVAGVLLANRWLFGIWTPVSSVIKQQWARELLAADPVYLNHGWLAAKLYALFGPLVRHGFDAGIRHLALGWSVAAVACAILAFGLWRQRVSASLRDLAPWLLFAAIKYPLLTLSLHGGLRLAPWYWAQEALIAAVLLAVASKRLVAPHAGQLAITGLIVLAIVADIGALAEVRASSRFGAMQPAIDWLRREVSADARIAAWNAGALGFLSGRTVVNLDGLVNEPAFLHEKRDLCRYFDQQGITYIVDAFRDLEAIAPVPTLYSYERCLSRFESLHEWPGEGYRLKAFRLSPEAAR